MRKPNYILRRLVAGALIAAVIYLVTAYLWYTGDGFCVGTMTSCVNI